MITITRKIKIYVNEPDKEQKKHYYDTLFRWLKICRDAANLCSSHRFIQDNMKDFFYYEDGVKRKLANIEKDPEGMFNTSSDNTLYRVLSSKYKGEMPMASLSMLNNVIAKTYKEEKAQYYSGKRSLRSYKNNIPIPVTKQQFNNIQIDPEKGYDYMFLLTGIPMKTFFGRDRSGNKTIFERAINKEFGYSMCDSNIQYDDRKNDWYLLFTVKFPEQDDKKIKGKEMKAKLDVVAPIVWWIKSDDYENRIGSKDEFLMHRMSIQRALHSRMMNARYNSGGHGRKKKMRGIEFFKNKETNYVKTKMHQYSAKLIQEALKHKVEKIILLLDKPDKESESEREKMLIRNWSYYGLADFIKYKAKKHGIVVEEEKAEIEKEKKSKKNAVKA